MYVSLCQWRNKGSRKKKSNSVHFKEVADSDLFYWPLLILSFTWIGFICQASSVCTVQSISLFYYKEILYSFQKALQSPWRETVLGYCCDCPCAVMELYRVFITNSYNLSFHISSGLHNCSYVKAVARNDKPPENYQLHVQLHHIHVLQFIVVNFGTCWCFWNHFQSVHRALFSETTQCYRNGS